MKNLNIVFLLLMIFSLASCGGSKKLTKFDEETAHHKRIAVIPLQSKIKLTPKQKESISDVELVELQIAQGKDVQDAVESYLVDIDLRVRIQSSNLTNSKLKENRIDLRYIQDQDYTKLATILGVDAIVAGYIETQKPMTEKLATKLNVAKSLERGLLGTSFGSNVNTSTNKGFCKLSLYDGVTGDRLWSYKDDVEMEQGSTTQNMIDVMMKKGAKAFPYKK